MRAVNETEWQEYLERYRSNDWACEPPPVCTARVDYARLDSLDLWSRTGERQTMDITKQTVVRITMLPADVEQALRLAIESHGFTVPADAEFLWRGEGVVITCVEDNAELPDVEVKGIFR